MLQFKIGGKYTIYVLNALAMTSKKEILVIGGQDNKLDPYTRDIIFKDRGKRKAYILPMRTRSYQTAPIEPFDGAVFEGWDQPIKCDTEGSCFRGNACYNFIGDPLEVKAWIETGQINPNFDKSKVLAIVSAEDTNSKECVVYPELYKGDNAVIDRVLSRV